MCCKKQKSKQKTEDDKEKLTTFVYVKDTIIQLLWPTFGYYNDVVSDYFVLKDYFISNEYGYFGITCAAMFCSLLAQTLYSKSVTTFSITKTSKYLRFLISICYGTPLFIVYYMINYEWICKKRSKEEHNTQQEDPNQLKFMILDESIIENNRMSIFKSYFQSTILTFVQVYILAQYIILKPSKTALSYPSTDMQFAILLWSTSMSFKSLADCAWARIQGFITKTEGVGTGIKILFRVRAITETFIRALRFMICSVIFYDVLYGGSVGIIILFLEFMWKFIVCCWFGRGRTDIDMKFRIYTVATWMIFSHERFKQYPYYMRICDIFLWTAIITITPIALNYVEDIHNILHFDGICTQFVQFKSDCIPMEFIFLLALFWIILSLCYCFTPSIFSMNYKSEVTHAQSDANHLKQHHLVEMVDSSAPTTPNIIEIAPTTNSNEIESVNDDDTEPTNTETTDTICAECEEKLNGANITMLMCRHCKLGVLDKDGLCVECRSQDTKQYTFCKKCRKFNDTTANTANTNENESKNDTKTADPNGNERISKNDSKPKVYQRGTGRSVPGIRDYTMTNAPMIHRFSNNATSSKNDLKPKVYQRGTGRSMPGIRDYTMTNSPMIDRFSNNTTSFERGAGRFGKDYITSQSMTLNAFNPHSNTNSNHNAQLQQTFQRGMGRFNNDYTMQQSETINAFNPHSNPQQTFERGTGRSSNDYTMQQSQMINAFNPYQRGVGRFNNDYTMQQQRTLNTFNPSTK